MAARISKHALVFLLLGATALFLVIGVLKALPDTQNSATAYQEDINADGRVTLVDVLVLLLLGRSNPADPLADYNGDGAFSINDATALLLNIFKDRLTPLEVVIHPVETNEFLLNPGVGFTSPNTTDSDLRRWNPRYPLCATAYYRWYWNEIEPAEGQIDFAMIDSLLAQLNREKQAFAFRIMCQNGSLNVPKWLVDKGLKGRYYNANGTGGFQPDYGDPLFKEYHGRLIRALGERYDGHPDIHHVDLGSVGSWGEWNTAGAPAGFEMPPDSVLKGIIDLYAESFTKSKLVMLIGGDMKYAIEKGAGWRADCLGDWGMWSANWSHMTTLYPQALAGAPAALDAWRHAPVAMEACGTGTTWYTQGMGVLMNKEAARDTTIKQSLAWHTSTMNFVYGPSFKEVPDEWINAYYEWGKKMGYRFVLGRLAHPARITAGGRMALRMDWKNAGVAPCYYAHPLAVQFRGTVSGETRMVLTDADIRGWMPGEVSYGTVVTVPDNLPPGEYEVGIALLDLKAEAPRIKFAIEGVAQDGWYRLSRVQVR